MFDFSFLNTFLSPYNIDQKWYPYIVIGGFLILLLIVYLIFMYIRAFISWITGNNEVIALQEENNRLLENLITLQNEQLSLLEALYIEHSPEEIEEENFMEIDETIEKDSEKNPEETQENPKTSQKTK